MRISTNILSLTAQRHLSTTSRSLAKAMERLSTGHRINRASDDAAGMALSERLKSAAIGFSRVSKNLNEAFGYLQTIDGALTTQIELVQRMRELALQSSSGTLAVNERAHLDREFQSLMSEFTRLTEQAEFNGVPLLNGSLQTVSIQAGIQKGQTIDFSLPSTRQDSIFTLDPESGSIETEPLGTFSVAQTFDGISNSSVETETMDVDNDGDLDILSIQDDALTDRILLNDGHGNFSIGTSHNFGLAERVRVGDLNGDEFDDVAIVDDTTGNIAISFGNGDGTFDTRVTFASGSGAERLEIADADGDGVDDIITLSSTTDSFYIHINDGAGNLALTHTVTPGGNLTELIVGDINNDGRADVGSGGDLGTTQFFINNGSGSFSLASTFTALTTNRSRDLHDIDGDGNLDYIYTNNSGAGQFVIRWGLGNGSFSAALTTNVALTTNNSRFGYLDINHDGLLDITVGGDSGSGISMILGTGVRTFSASTMALDNGSSGLKATVDFNGDGHEDFLFDGTMFGSSTLYVFTQDTIVTTIEPSAEVDLNLLTQENSQNLLSVLDNAIQTLVGYRSNVGASMSRMEFAQSNANLSELNISASLSQLKDADFAAEVSELTRAQILQQAGASVLIQANTSLQIVLGLLRP